MKICLTQIESIKGNIQENIRQHFKFIPQAITLSADLIVFPELSLTSYAPDLAKELATSIENILFEPFQTIANKHKLTLCIGMPTKQLEGIAISLLIFQPNKKRTKYSKQILHTDETPYFICGKTASFLTLKGEKVALGICYETLQIEHFLNAKENGATIYVASVTKPTNGIKKAYTYFPQSSKKLKIPVLMVNSIGACTDFVSAGSSAVWNKNGILLQQLETNTQKMLLYDSVLDTVEVEAV